MADQAAVTFLLEQVTGVIKGYPDLISGADKEFKRMKDDVEVLKALLRDTASKLNEDHDAKFIKNQIRKVVYEVEDAIDSLLTESKDKPRSARGVTNLNFAKKVESLRQDKVKDMLEMASKMKRDLASVGKSKEEDAKVDDPPIRQEKVVGLKDEEEKITGYLTRDQPELDIIPIIGMPGLGKTTLTWKIYNDEKTRYEFPIRIWVHFSHRFSSKDVLIQIMKHFTSYVDELHNKTDKELRNIVHQCLSGERRFLLVVDNVWLPDHWDAIKYALPYSNGNGKVMITSREMTVGIHVQHITEPHQLRALSPDESWELLQLEVFGRLESCPDPLKSIGYAIAKKCKGLPLAVVVIGRVLKDQYWSFKADVQLVKEKWNEVSQNKNLAYNKMKSAPASVGTSNEEDSREWREVPIRREKVVGLKDEEEKIIGYLRKDQLELDIIPIIGMPGLGKTTLTWEIFNDVIIRYEFPIRIWVHFSKRFHGKDVLIQIMKHFTSNIDELYSKGERELCYVVHACLSREKFLLVVDDVWLPEHWDVIKEALPYSNNNGKVMITSREMRVGRHVQHITEPHQLRPLFPYESWELLQFEVFGELEVCPDPLKGIGNVIAVKCKGIPLTIVVLGGVLKDIYLSLKSVPLVKDRWNEVAEKGNLALQDKKKVIVDAVKLSYDILPESLRDCFLYLGVFPAGYPVQTWTLMRLWIAEGFIQPDGKRSLEKIAEEYMNDLISRNLLMVHKMNPMREVKICRVPDMIRMFCVNEAEKLNLFKRVRMSEEDYAYSAYKIENIHRLCLHSDLDRFLNAKLKGPHVHSFLCFQDAPTSLDENNISAISENFESLRILHTKSIKFKGSHPKVFISTHLRYIVVSVPELDILLEPISQPWNLQTIVIDTNSESLTMKANIWKMIRLRHVKTKAAIVLDTEFVQGEVRDNLQTLNRLSPESVKLALPRARYLKTLGVRGNLATLFNVMPSGNLNHLEKLKFYQTAASENRLQQLPDLNHFAPNLKRLTLSKTFLEWKHMRTLAMIPGLEVLKLKENAFTGITWEAETYTFKKLQCLLILTTDLIIWTASDSTFPCLRHLELKSCEDLFAIPDCVLQRLENLDIDRVHKSIADSAKNLTVQLKLGANLI